MTTNTKLQIARNQIQAEISNRQMLLNEIDIKRIKLEGEIAGLRLTQHHLDFKDEQQE